MSRTRTPEQDRAAYNWLSTAQVAEILGAKSTEYVCILIREGHLKPPGVMNISRSKRPRYRISKEAVDQFIQESTE